MLKDYLKRYFGWSEDQTNGNLKDKVIFGRTSKVNSDTQTNGKQPKHLLESCTLMKSFANYIEKLPELNQKNPNGRKQIHFHGFRKFFRTTVGNVCGRDFAEAVIGHGFYMDTYYNLSSDEKRTLYIKAEPSLTISDFTKVEKDLISISETQRQILEKIAALEKNSIQVPSQLLT
jgi:hypothetical protein